MKIQVATVNIAGASRQENADLCKYAILGNLLYGVDIIGLQEVIQVYDSHNVIVDDIKELQDNSGLLDYHHYFFPNLDSIQQSHPNKWSSKIFNKYYEKGHRILQGTAILIKREHYIYDFWSNDRLGHPIGQMIPWYSDTPTFYLGHRDTEPRILILTRIRLANKFILFCCTQLTTLKEENIKECGKDKRVSTQNAIDIRTKQINWIVQYINSYQKALKEENKALPPMILVGDFNAEPTASELNGLRQMNLELVPFTTSNVGSTHRKHNTLIDLIYATRGTIRGNARIVDLKDFEAFSDKRISDHNPVIAKLEFCAF